MGRADGPDSHLYRTARLVAAGALFGLVIVLGLVDVLDHEYSVDPIVDGILLAAALLLMGIDTKGLR